MSLEFWKNDVVVTLKYEVCHSGVLLGAKGVVNYVYWKVKLTCSGGL